MLRILLADDSAIFRQAIRKLLEGNPRFVICGEAANGDDAVNKAGELRPDVILLDLSIPGMRGAEIIDGLKSKDLQTRVIIISEQDEEVLRQLTRSLDVAYAIPKSTLATELIPVLDSLLR